MTRLASRFGTEDPIRCDRPLTIDELAHYVLSSLVLRSQQAVV